MIFSCDSKLHIVADIQGMDKYFASFHGYPTYFDASSNSWKPLCEGLCIIELSTPPAIFLKNGDGIIIHGIQLKDTFSHVMQSPTAVMLRTSDDTSTAATYGFAFTGGEVGKGFETALAKLEEYYKLKAAAPPVSEAKPQVMQQNFVVQEEINPLAGVACKDADKVNEFIMEHGGATQEDDDLCQALSKAVGAGDVEEAKRIVKELVNKKIKVKATYMCNNKPSKFDIKVYIESKSMCQEEPITLFIDDPDTITIMDLKKQMFAKYDFPISIQRFIIRDRLTKDAETLTKCGIHLDDTKIYLYLKSLDDTETKTKETQTEKVTYHDPVTMNMDFLPQQGLPMQRGFLPRNFPPQQDFPSQQDFPRQNYNPFATAFRPRMDFQPRQDFGPELPPLPPFYQDQHFQ